MARTLLTQKSNTTRRKAKTNVRCDRSLTLRRIIMNRFRNLVTVFAFSLLILGLPAIASAQWGNNRNDDYNRNGGYNRNDDYNRNNGNYNRNLQSTIKNLKNRSNQFERQIDRALDNSRYNEKNREDRLNKLAKDFADAADDLDDRYDNRGNYNTSQNEVQRVLTLGSQIDRQISRARLNNNVQNDWNKIRQDLQVLASAYNYNNNNRNNRGNNRNDDYNNNRNRNTNNGNWRNNIPFPLPF